MPENSQNQKQPEKAFDMKELTATERMRLEELFYSGWLHISEEDEHWIHGYDEGLSYCRECAVKKVKELRKSDPDREYSIDGGWGTDGDSTPFCETCGQRLSNTLTQYGCESEVDHFLMYGFDPMSPYNCLDMHGVVESSGWEPFIDIEDEPYFKDLYRLCRRILNDNFWIMPDNDYRHMWE